MDKVGIGSKGHRRSQSGFCRSVGRSMEIVIHIAGIGAIILLVLMFVFIIVEAVIGLFQLYSTDHWSIAGSLESQIPRYSIISLVINSALLALGAIVVALPLGLGTALYITEIAPQRIARVFCTVVKGMDAVPPVIIGFLGFLLVGSEKHTLGTSSPSLVVLSSLLLGLMIYPSVVCFLVDTLRRIPTSFKASSYALGASRWQTIAHTIYPAAQPGIAAAGLFGFGRVLGDTVIVLMLLQGIFGARLPSASPLLTMPMAIATGATTAVPRDGQYHVLYLVGLLLTVISYSLSSLGRRLLRTQRGEVE